MTNEKDHKPTLSILGAAATTLRIDTQGYLQFDRNSAPRFLEMFKPLLLDALARAERGGSEAEREAYADALLKGALDRHFGGGVEERPGPGTITHMPNPATGLWDRIRPLDLQKALADAFEAGIKFALDFHSPEVRIGAVVHAKPNGELDYRPIAEGYASRTADAQFIRPTSKT